MLNTIFISQIVIYICNYPVVTSLGIENIQNRKFFDIRDLGKNPYVKGENVKGKRISIVRAGLIFAACLMIVLGAMRGEVQTVLSKAIKLCMECVGIG